MMAGTMTIKGATKTMFAFLLWILISLGEAKKVAIIGAGVSGTFSAKYLADYDKDCSLESVTIFDPMPVGKPVNVNQKGDPDWQGSRVASLELDDGKVVELGASVAIQDFRLVVNMLEGDPALKTAEPHNTGEQKEKGIRQGIGIYDGAGTWKLLTSDASFLSKLKMLYRYNFDLWTMSRAAKTAETGLARVHRWLDSTYPSTFFESSDEMWTASGLVKPAHMSFDAFLDALGLEAEVPWWRSWLPFQGSLRAELLTAINLCNYNQANSQVNGLVGVGSFISAKVALFSVVGGNYQIIQSAYKQAQTVHDNQCQGKGKVQHVAKRVTTVVGDLENGMEVYSESDSLGHFDVVILAAPIQQCRIDFMITSDKDSAVLHDMPLFGAEKSTDTEGSVVPPTPLPDSATRAYTQVVTTVLSNATLSPEHFFMQAEQELPRGIYMTENGKEKEDGITAITQLSTHVYKMFSSHELDEEKLNSLFEPGYKIEYMKLWGGPHGGATPDYRGEGTTIPYLLYDSSGVEGISGGALYYPNAIEASFACMELSAIGAKSVARLVAKRLGLLVPQDTREQSDEL